MKVTFYFLFILSIIPGYPEALFVQEQNRLVWTSDRGKTWTGEDLNNELCCIEFTNAHTGWAGVNGTSADDPLVYKWNGNLLTATEEPLKNSLQHIRVFPNPSQDLVHYILEGGNTSTHRVTVTDATGQIVLDKRSDDQVLQFGTFPPGLYILHVRNDSTSGIAKVIKN